MMLRNFSWLIFLTVAAATSLSAAEITGKVRDASGDAATIMIDGEALPAVGDSAEIFFKVPGADEEISVASGKVAAVEAKVVRIKIDKATGAIEKDQLARIKSGSSPTTASTSPSPRAPSAPAPTGPSIVGDWLGTSRAEEKFSVSFKEDGTFLLIFEFKGAPATMRGKYRVDITSQPNRIDMFEITPATELGAAISGILEMQADGRLKLDLSDEYQKKPGQGFTTGAVVLSKATSPIVPPPEKKPADTSPKSKAPDASPPGTAPVSGDWTSTAPGGEIVSFSFKEDGTLLFVTENAQSARSTSGKYRIDSSTKPQGIELFDFEEGGDMSGERLRGIFELQSDGRLKLDFMKDPAAPPLKEFTKEALVFSKAATPVVRPNKPTPTPDVAPAKSPDEKLIEEGNDLSKRKDYDGAIKAYTKAIELNPKNAGAYSRRGGCFQFKEDYDAAIADYKKAIALDPSRYSEDLGHLIESLKLLRAAKKEHQKRR